MNYLKTRALIVALALIAPSIALADEPVDVGVSGPEQQEQYRFQPALVFVGGAFDQSSIDTENGQVFGVELGVNSPIRLVPPGRLRHVFGLGVSSVEGRGRSADGFGVLSVELNTYYMKPVGRGFRLGAGAGLGYVRIKQDALTGPYSASGAQLAVVLDYPKGRWVFGGELRRQLTGEFGRVSANAGDQDSLSRDVDLPNTRFLLKAGYSFTP